MTIKQQIEQDLKQAMLGGDKTLTTTLRGVKSAILDAEIAKGVRDKGLVEEEVIALLQKEAKKRQDSADLFKQGGNTEKAQAELAEKRQIETYLPAQLSENELSDIVEEAIKELGVSGPQAMGQVIGQVKQRTGGKADGGRIAAIVRERLAG
jgi:uncharacterized protein YqeY